MGDLNRMLDGNCFWAKMQLAHNHDRRYLDGSFSGLNSSFTKFSLILRMVSVKRVKRKAIKIWR